LDQRRRPPTSHRTGDHEDVAGDTSGSSDIVGLRARPTREQLQKASPPPVLNISLDFVQSRTDATLKRIDNRVRLAAPLNHEIRTRLSVPSSDSAAIQTKPSRPSKPDFVTSSARLAIQYTVGRLNSPESIYRPPPVE
jgi:hypothetical protein